MLDNEAVTEEEKKRLHRKKTRALALKMCLYTVCAGAFGAFARWMQVMLAFDEEGLNKESLWNVAVPLIVIAAALVFAKLVNNVKNGRYSFRETVGEVFAHEGTLYELVPLALGAVMLLGGLLMLKSAPVGKKGLLTVAVAAGAALSGAAYPLLLHMIKSEKPRYTILCVLSFLPILTFALWIILTYKLNAINSVTWQFGVEILAVCGAVMGFFRVGGFVFDRPTGWRAMFASMFGGFICITALADTRDFCQQMIFAAAAGMLLYYLWLLCENLGEGAAKKKPSVNDGFEHLNDFKYQP